MSSPTKTKTLGFLLSYSIKVLIDEAEMEVSLSSIWMVFMLRTETNAEQYFCLEKKNAALQF